MGAIVAGSGDRFFASDLRLSIVAPAARLPILLAPDASACLARVRGAGIAAFGAQARRAPARAEGWGGGETALDWPNLLEWMHMDPKQLSADELDPLKKLGTDAGRQADASWADLVEDVRRAMQRAEPADSAAAQALAWRWMRLKVRMTTGDGAPATAGTPPAMVAWIAQAFAHARCTLFARHLSPAQTEAVRRRQLAATADSSAWPTLVAELRALLEAGVDAAAEPVQTLVERWQRLFRDSYCGDDSALEARVREAFMREPDLRLGEDMDEALLTYLQKAYVVAHHLPRANAGPKPSALMVAKQRAAHQLLETPRVLDDPLALPVLGATEAQAMCAELDRYRAPMAVGLRTTVVVRSRLAEDEWARAVERGVRQCVILGAGLDTSAYRHQHAGQRVFEVDLPATQAWKQARLREAGIAVPASLRFVPVDFERVSLGEGLAHAGFDLGQPAFFIWLGVTMYLDEAAVFETLRFIAGCAGGSAVIFDHVTPLAELPGMLRIAMTQVAAQLAEQGEPWKSYFNAAALATRLATLGFRSSRTWTPDELNQRYLANRVDGLQIGTSPSRLVLAEV